MSDPARRAIALHARMRGKLTIASKVPLKTRAELSLVYTPGVGAVSAAIAAGRISARDTTFKGNSVAVVSDGSAVLGLGNIGPDAALPVMEGKALLFKKFAGIDAFPIVLATQDTEEIIAAVKAIAPTFGGINLEDISAPRCFEIEKRLIKELSIPVMHDDQHGTAIVVLAAIENAARVVRKSLRSLRVVVNGAGPAGTAVAYILRNAEVRQIIILDSQGIISSRRRGLEPYKRELARRTNPRRIRGGISEALQGADVFIGVSRANLLTADHIRLMASRPIVFAMANPVPEIMPEEARAGGAVIVATGRSDFPNQINNALAFPGVFRGALDHSVRRITDQMKIRAAHAIAGLVKNPSSERIIPSIFDRHLVKAVTAAIQ